MTRLPQIALLPDGKRLHLQDGPIDLIIEGRGSETELRAAYRAAATRFTGLLDELSDVIATSRNYQALTDAWTQWHSVARPMRPKYQRFVELANEGAKELGFDDVGVLWRSGYDMSAEDFQKEAARLYDQVKPLYQDLHCYARKRLAQLVAAAASPTSH